MLRIITLSALTSLKGTLIDIPDPEQDPDRGPETEVTVVDTTLTKPDTVHGTIQMLASPTVMTGITVTIDLLYYARTLFTKVKQGFNALN